MRALRALSLAAGVSLTAAVLSGCGTPPWETAGSAGPTRSATPTSTSTASAAPTPVPNDLSAGSTKRSLSAGPLTVAVDYYSDLPMDQWTADALKPLTLSMTTTVIPDDGHKVYLQQASVIAVPRSDDETLDALAAQVDTATVSPGYLVLSPYSYSQTFDIGALPDDAVAVTLQISYDFLVQTTPTSSEYAKQSVTDTLVVAIADAPR